MAEWRVTTKAELLADTDRNWKTLSAFLDGLTDAQLSAISDAQGWTVKDHLIHLTAWERSAVYFLQGKPRHVGLGTDEATYLTGDDDVINAAIYERQKAMPLADALTQFRAVHQQLLKTLEPLTDADLQKPYHHYLPDEPGVGEGPQAINVVYGNSAYHFMEHLPWIEALVKS
jgi:uncharacterized protein (TIGR03083 family)